MELAKPWVDDRKYKLDRLTEAKYEAELARKFLEDGLYRNAAGKAFQAWKAVLAALAVDHVNEIAKYFKGKMRMMDGRTASYAEWIATVMPTSKMTAVAQVLDGLFNTNEVELFTDIAIKLHEFQYNGLDKAGELSPYPSLEFVRMDLEKLIKAVEEFVERETRKA